MAPTGSSALDAVMAVWSERKATVPSSATDGSQLALYPARRLATSGVGAMVDTMSTAPVAMLKRNTLLRPLPLCGVADISPAESKAAHSPLGLMAGCCEGSGDWPAPGFSDSRRVSPVFRSRTKTSISLLVSPGTRLGASDSKTTNRPSPLMAGQRLAPLACAPPAPTLTRSVVPLCRLRMKMSEALLVSPGTRLDESEAKATRFPSDDTAAGEPGSGANESGPWKFPLVAKMLTRIRRRSS